MKPMHCRHAGPPTWLLPVHPPGYCRSTHLSSKPVIADGPIHLTAAGTVWPPNELRNDSGYSCSSSRVPHTMTTALGVLGF